VFGEIGEEAGKRTVGINGAGRGVGHHERVHHVLIADDDRAIRESLARALELEGYAVTVVVDGVEALTHGRGAGFDALVLDVMMPGVDGLGVCRVLRAGGDRTDGMLRVAALRVDPAARRAWWADAELSLSKTEFDLLELLVRNEGIVLDHSTIFHRMWGYDFGADSKNLAVYVGYLRRKLAAAGAPDVIHTVRGVGYSLRRP
jgi:two-component system response regulator MprA